MNNKFETTDSEMRERERKKELKPLHYYPRRSRSAIGVDIVFTLDVCLYVCYTNHSAIFILFAISTRICHIHIVSLANLFLSSS